MIKTTDPIVMKAVVRVGFNPLALKGQWNGAGDYCWNYDGHDQYGYIIMRGPATAYQITSITVRDNNRAWIRWKRPSDGKVIRYEIENIEEGGIITVENTELPDAILEGMKGMPLMNIVGVPGGENMCVVSAVNSRAFVGDPWDLRILVESA